MPLENTDAEERITRETMIGWIEHWGESYDDVRPDDGAMRLANRIIEYNAAVEAIEALRNPDAVYDELASILQPVLSSMDGTYFAGSEWFAGEVDRMEADRINGEQPEETDGLASEEPRIPFIVESEATAADTDEPPLDELITAATHEYLDSGMTYDGFSEHVRTTWRNAAAYDWSKLMAEPRSTGEWSSDANRLAVLGVMMQFAPESTCMMIASDILAENAPLSLPALRERINTPDGMVNTDLLFSRLIDNGTTSDPARIDMAMGILGPLEANAPTDACYRIIGLKAMLSLAMGDGEKARELAEQAIGYDASDRFASSVLDRLPETDPAMEAASWYSPNERTIIMPQSMQVVRGLLAANPDYWPAKTNADGTTSSAYLRATVYEDRPRVRQKDGSYTDNPLGPVRTTVKFWGQAAELLHGMDFRQGDAVVATGRMGDPDAFISQKDGKAYARPVVIGDSMQIDSIVSQRIQLARERKRQNKEQAGAVADAGRTDPWTDQVDASRGEYVGDGVPRTFNGEPFEPLSGYPTPGAAPAPADPAAPDFLSTPSDSTTGNAR